MFKNIEDMTPEEAKELLLQERKKNRQRQRDYVKRKQEEGRKRINTFVSAEAGDFLEDEMRRTHRGYAEIINEALLFLKRAKEGESKVADFSVRMPPPSSAGPHAHPGYDESAVIGRITDLAGQGMNGQEIADILSAEGLITKTGLDRWSKTVVHRWLKKLGLK
jgi:hypothetical protein